MYSEVLTAGKHLIYDIQNIKNTSLLNNPTELKNVLLHICNKYNFTILNTVQHIFSPEGYSLIFLLSGVAYNNSYLSRKKLHIV